MEDGDISKNKLDL